VGTNATDPLSPPQLALFQSTLENGLTVVIQQDPATVLAAVNLWYNVGSRDEPKHRTGFAHLFEHLMFAGSAHVKANEHFAFLEKFGATLNATTSIDRTNYFEVLPVEHLDLALWLEADRMGSLNVDQKNLDTQREVVKEEKRQRYDNQPGGSLFMDLLSALFPVGHPYHHAPIGSMEHLDAADLDYVRTFHATYYGPNTAVLTVISPLPPDVVLERINHYFAGIEAIATPPPTPDASVEKFPLDAPFRRTIEDRLQTAIVGLGWRVPGYGDADHDAVQVALMVIGAGKGSRLAKALTRDQQLVMPSGGYVQAMEWDQGCSMAVGQLQCRAGVSPEQVIDALASEFDRLASEPPTDAELQRAKALAAAGWMGQLSSVANRADEIGRITTKFGDANRINQELDGILAVTSQDVARVTAAYLSFDGNAVISYVPAKDQPQDTDQPENDQGEVAA
jgi:zinc protease